MIPLAVLFNAGAKGLLEKEDLPLWIFLALLSAGMLNAVDKHIANRTFGETVLIAVSMYYLGKVLFRSGQRFYAGVICFCAAAVALGAAVELFCRRNFLYEFLYNPYYERYLLAGRPMSTQYNPAALGSFLLGCLPFFVFFLGRKERFWGWKLAGFVICLFVIIASFSRGVFLGLIASSLFFLAMTGKRRLLGVALAVIFLVITISSFSGNTNLNRFGFSRFIAGSGDSIISPYRLDRVKMSAAMVHDHPLAGVGLNNFRVLFSDYQAKRQYETEEFKIADNMYLTLAAEAGLPCLAVFLAFVFFLFKRGFRFARGSLRPTALVVMAALTGLLVNMGAYELFYWHNIFMLFCLICGFLAAGEIKNEVPA